MDARRAACLLAGVGLVAGAAHAQDESKRYSTGRIRVGDRVEIPSYPPGKWAACTVIGARPLSSDPSKIDAYQIRCDQGYPSNAIADTDHVRPAAAGAAAAPSWNVVDASKVGPKGSNVYGARNPRACTPVRTLTPATAAQAVICGYEGERGHMLYLAEAVSVRLGGPTRYDPHTQTGFTNMDTGTPPIAITGSFVAYQCGPQEADPKAYGYNYNTNCSRYDNRNAKGYCWKQRTGEWKCAMNDIFMTEADKHFRVAPPR